MSRTGTHRHGEPEKGRATPSTITQLGVDCDGQECVRSSRRYGQFLRSPSGTQHHHGFGRSVASGGSG